MLSQCQKTVWIVQRLCLLQKHYNLLPGRYFASGYHFSLYPNPNGSVPIMTVFGTVNGYFAKVYFNIETEKVINASYTAASNGGIWISDNNKPVQLLTGINNQYQGVSTSLTSKIIVSWGVKSPYSIYQSPVYSYSLDGGESWSENVAPYYIQNMWISSSEDKFFAIMNNALYQTSIKSTNWSLVLKPSVSPQTANILSAYNREKIVLWDSQNLYISNDEGKTWVTKSINLNIQSITIASDGVVYLKTSNQIITVSNSNVIETIRTPAVNILGLTASSNGVVIYTNNSAYIRPDSTTKWELLPVHGNIIQLYATPTNNEIFAQHDDGKIESIFGGGGQKNIPLPSEGFVFGVIRLAENKAVIAVSPSKIEIPIEGIN